MITVIPTRRARSSGSGVVIAVAIVAALGAAYLAFGVPFGDEAITSFAADPAARAALAIKESS